MTRLTLVTICLFLFLSTQVHQGESLRFRCGLLSFLGMDRACRASCAISGQISGYCDDNMDCICSETGKPLFNGKNLFVYIKEKIYEWKDKVVSSELDQSVRDLMPSRCRIGHGFCESSCHAIGRVTGECNDDFSDCECSAEMVTPKQYAMCLDEGVCSVGCQKDGFSKGECQGMTGWDCKCINVDKEDGEEEVDFTIDVDEMGEDFYEDLDLRDLGIDVRNGFF